MSLFYKVQQDFQDCLHQWNEFEIIYDHVAAFVKDMESQLRMINLQPSQQAKQTQLYKIRVSLYASRSFTCHMCTFMCNTNLRSSII